MGYMGFGMQKWIYAMSPRKPFSKSRKSSFTSLPKYKRNFKSQPSKSKGNINLSFVLFLLFALFLVLKAPKWLEHSISINQKKELRERELDNKAFDFLIESGEKRLYSGKISGAYSEFKLAYKIKPQNEKLNKLLTETLEILCLDYNRHCENYYKLKGQ